MRTFERVLQQADAGEYDWGVASGALTPLTRQQAGALLLELYVAALSVGASTDNVAVRIIEGVPEQCSVGVRELGTTFSVSPGSGIVCQVTEVKPSGKSGTGGGRVVFASLAVAKQGPGVQLVNAIVKSPTFSPIRLKARADWNKYFRTVDTPFAPEVAVTGIQQQQKQKGSGLDTWIKFGQLSFDVAIDCKLQIQNVHPDLNGFHQVDKVDPKGLRIAIRASLFSEAQIHEMNSATSLSTGNSPSLKKFCQVDRSKILHWVTVAGITATDVSGMVVEVPTFENLLKQGVSLAVPAPPAASSYQHGFLAHGVSQPVLPGSQQHLPVFPSTVLRSRRQSSPLEQWADWQEAVTCLNDTFRTYQQQNDTRVGRLESHAADLAENIVDLSLEVYSCPEKDILDYLIDPEGGETMPDQSRSQETHFSGPAIYATTPAPPPSDATGSVPLTFPTGDLDSLQDAVIKALQQQPNSTPLRISYNVWPRHENPQLESKRRPSMKTAVIAALYRLPSAAFVAQGGTQKKLWSLSPDF